MVGFLMLFRRNPKINSGFTMSRDPADRIKLLNTMMDMITIKLSNAGFRRAVRGVQNAIKWSAAEWHFGHRVLRRSASHC